MTIGDERMIIAIDGPSGSGKSSVAKLLAQKAGFRYIDTGAMYRALTYEALRQGVDLDQEEKREEFLGSMHLSFEEGDQLFVNGRRVGDEIRTPEVTRHVSGVSAYPRLRAFLVEFQRSCAQDCNTVMDGRDIATVVFPDAQLKIYLSATPEVRAKRRTKEMHGKGIEISYEQVLEEVLLRDYKDSHRAVSPLRKHQDAVEIDTSAMTMEEVVEKILDQLREKEGF